ncbi:Acidic repeat-containing protein [Schistosoma japonicum]|nr:Acidic repeat-containing protein [Schistosoma japonicum]
MHPVSLQYDEPIHEKSRSSNFEEEKSSIKNNVPLCPENISKPFGEKSPVNVVIESDYGSDSCILARSNSKRNDDYDNGLLNFLEIKTIPSTAKCNPDVKTNASFIHDRVFEELLESSRVNINMLASNTDLGIKSHTQTSSTPGRNFIVNIKPHSSDDDDEAFENFLKFQTAKINKPTSNRDSDWLSWDSTDDDESSYDSPYQAFYYRVNNKLQLQSDITRLPLKLSDSELSYSDKENLVPTEHSPSCTVQVSTYLNASSCQKSLCKTGKRKSLCVSTEEFVYSLYPVSNSDNSKYASHKKLRHPDALKFVQKFKSNRSELADKLYRIYNEKIFSNQLPSKLEIIWSRRLLKTAGLCKYMTSKTTLSDGTSNQVRIAQILLSEKVCTTAERVRDTLLHEICHVAVWLIDGLNDGHGRHWKSWANRAHRIWPKLPLISVCHAYTIDTRFTYRCTGCGVCINRHSKSLDIAKKICGHCCSKFELLINTPKGRMLRPSIAAQYDKRLLPHCTSNKVIKVPSEPEQHKLSETSHVNDQNCNVEDGLLNMFRDLHLPN